MEGPVRQLRSVFAVNMGIPGVGVCVTVDVGVGDKITGVAVGPSVEMLVAVSVGNTSVGTGVAPRLHARLAKTRMVKAVNTFFIRSFPFCQ